MEALTHWDDLAADHHELGPMNARWRTVGGVRLGMSRIDILPGGQSTPAHVHTAEEELFYVLRRRRAVVAGRRDDRDRRGRRDARRAAR